MIRAALLCCLLLLSGCCSLNRGVDPAPQLEAEPPTISDAERFGVEAPIEWNRTNGTQ